MIRRAKRQASNLYTIVEDETETEFHCVSGEDETISITPQSLRERHSAIPHVAFRKYFK